jgi:hypothetical protein
MRLMGIHGELTGQRFDLETAPLTMGRGADNHVILSTRLASRHHAELRPDGGGWTLHDGGSTNGTAVNGRRVRSHRLRPGDEIAIGHEVFRLEVAPAPAAEPRTTVMASVGPPVLRVTVSGGGPVGLTFALLLDDLMGPRAEIVVHDGRWTPADERRRGLESEGARHQPSPAGRDGAEPPVAQAAGGR